MNMQSNAITDSNVATQAAAAVDISAARRFYWSVRRELWEYRSLYVAPVAVAAVILISFLFSVVRLPVRLHGISGSDPMHQHNVIEQPYLMTALFLMGVTLVVAIFYCLDTLQGERRDRSILFWKSLPVSDVTTVLAKASIPIVILPLITFAVTAATQGMIFALSTVRLVGSGDGRLLWSHVPLLQMWAMEFYHLLVFHGFWYAPFFGWLLLASAWSRRAALLWAVLPPFAIGMLEKLAFNTTHFALMLKHHFAGMSGEAPPKPVHMMMDLLMPLTPSQLVASPGFWIGLAITAVFLAAAARLRRYREPN